MPVFFYRQELKFTENLWLFCACSFEIHVNNGFSFLLTTVFIYLLILKIVSEYDQEIPQSQTADNPVAPRGRAAQPSRDTRKTN